MVDSFLGLSVIILSQAVGSSMFIYCVCGVSDDRDSRSLSLPAATSALKDAGSSMVIAMTLKRQIRKRVQHPEAVLSFMTN